MRDTRTRPVCRNHFHCPEIQSHATETKLVIVVDELCGAAFESGIQ